MTPSPVDTFSALYVGAVPERAAATADALDAAHDRLSVEAMSCPNDALARLDDGVDCIVSELDVPDGDGIAFLERVRETEPDLPFVLVTDSGSEQVASDAISAGVTDYVPTHEGLGEVDALATRVVDHADEYRTPVLGERDEHHVAARTDCEWELARYQHVVDSVPTGLFVLNDADEFTLVNRRLIRLTGLDREDLLDEPVSRIVAEDDLERVRALGREVTPGDLESLEWQLDSPAGESFTVESRVTRLAEAHGGGSVWTTADVSGVSRERDRSPQHKRLEQYETILEALPVGVAVLDEAATVEWVNEEFWEVLDRTEDEVAGMPFLDLIEEGVIEPEITDKYLDAVRHLLSSDNDDDRVMVEFELDPPGEDHPRTYQGYVALQPFDGGGYDGTVNVFLDVTERRKRARELEQYQAAMETVPDGVFLLDEHGTMTRVNDAWASTVGYDPDELNGEPFLKLVEDGVIDPGSVEAYLDTLSRLLSSKTSTDRAKFTTTVTPLDGTGDRVFEVHVGLLPYEEEFRGAAGVVREVTQKMERQRQLERENERLEEFASIVSHDLRNPLTIAKGFTEKAQMTGDLDALDRALTALDRMEAITGDVLELSRQGKVITSTESVHIPTLFENCWETVETKSAVPRVDGADDVRIVADQDRLQQLFENLVRNAIEHGGEDVTVRVGAMESGFYVEDDGSGIPEEERDSIFDVGYSTAADGTGFGLNIVRQIAEAHGWQITAATGEDGGARFEITDVEFAGDR